MSKVLLIVLFFFLAPVLAHGGVDDELVIDAHSASSTVSSSHLYHYFTAFALVGIGMFGYYRYDKYKPKMK